MTGRSGRKIRGRAVRARRRLREARVFASALASPRSPILAHLVATRRCNLSCTYCNEFDGYSPPVPLPELLARVDRLAELGTLIVHLSGGEPLLHPQLDEVIRRIRSRGMMAGILTNAYLLDRERIRRLNQAGLDHLQISLDNVKPDSVSRKSLKLVQRRLEFLASDAEFDVNVNTVLGNELELPEDAVAITDRTRALGFTGTVGILHDQSGQLRPLSARHRRVYEEVMSRDNRLFSAAIYSSFQNNLVQGLPNSWHCPAGGRYLYVCEEGKVHYCSQQRGTPDIPLAHYSPADLEREYSAKKGCAPYCTISCVHRVAWLDQLRSRPEEALARIFPQLNEASPQGVPVSVRLLRWMFVSRRSSRRSKILSRAALKLLGVARPKAGQAPTVAKTPPSDPAQGS